MNLYMQGEEGFPQNLPALDQEIVTGPMSDCVSIIVLYNYNPRLNQYTSARGWHGLGGAQVINMGAMLRDVPNNPLTQVIIIPGSIRQSNYDRDQTMEHVQAGLVAHNRVNVRYIAGRMNSTTLNRQGAVT